MQRNAAKCDSGCRRWNVKVELAHCRNLFLKYVTSRRKQALQPGATGQAVTLRRCGPVSVCPSQARQDSSECQGFLSS